MISIFFDNCLVIAAESCYFRSLLNTKKKNQLGSAMFRGAPGNIKFSHYVFQLLVFYYFESSSVLLLFALVWYFFNDTRVLTLISPEVDFEILSFLVSITVNSDKKSLFSQIGGVTICSLWAY